MEAAGYDWSCELLVMQTGNDDYNSVCECVCVSVCFSFVDSEILTPLSSLYKCTDVLARRVQERALAAMFGKSLLENECLLLTLAGGGMFF